MKKSKKESKSVKPPKPKEFDLIKILKQKVKTENIILEGASIAFKVPDGNTGTWTLCDNLGVKLRLIQEGKIQDKIIEMSLDDMAKKSLNQPFHFQLPLIKSAFLNLIAQCNFLSSIFEYGGQQIS